MHSKLIERTLKLIKLINDMILFLDSKQSNLNFEPSFAAIHEVLREIWLFEHKFKLEILANFEFLGYQICQQTFNKIYKFRSYF